MGLLARAYGQLPSYVLANATSYDLKVFDTINAWEAKKHSKEPGIKPAPNLTQEQMRAMIDSVKQRKKNG